MPNLYFYPGLFSLGLAVGVVSLVFLLSLIISYAYNDKTLLVLATRLMVSGLRIDSPLLTGVEFKFRIVVSPLVADLATDVAAATIWLGQLAETFNHWPGSHRTRSILLLAAEPGTNSNVSGALLPPDRCDTLSDAQPNP